MAGDVPSICNASNGAAIPIPTLDADESTTNVLLSQLKSPVPPVKAVNVPTDVIALCAAPVTVAAVPEAYLLYYL